MANTATTATTTAAKTAAKKSVEQAVESVEQAETAATLSAKSLLTSRDVRLVAAGILGATLGHYAVLQGRAYLANRRLQKEIDEAVGGHESRESIA